MLLEKIAMQFKKPTGFWGKVVAALMVKGNKSAYDNLLKGMQIAENDKILEIGYGPGTGIKQIMQKYTSCAIYGIDFSELMFRKATQVNKSEIENGKVNLQFGDFLVEVIPTSGFQKVFCINVVYFWEHLQVPFAKIFSLLDSTGEFWFFMAKNDDLRKLKFTTDTVFNKYAIEQVVDHLKAVGFKEVTYTYNLGYYVKAKK